MYRYLVNKRIITVFFVFVSVLLILMGRLIFLQVFKYPSLLERGEDLWLRDLTLASPRGEIKDRNGEVIVANQRQKTLMITPTQVTDQEEAAHVLSDALDVEFQYVLNLLREPASVLKMREGIKLPDTVLKQLEEENINGFYFVDDYQRRYPYNTLLAHVLGFTGIDQQGLLGIEQMYDETLTGKVGRLRYYSDALGNRLPSHDDRLEMPEEGEDVILTIDLNIQEIIERELDQAVATYEPESAFAIVVNPNNGEVLAMASRPTFHPENYQDVSQEVYNRNLPIWSTFEPGSTFKIITLAAALEEEVVDLHNDHYFDTGAIEVANQRISCWKRGGHGAQTFLEVVENSCNPGFVTLGQRLGEKRLHDYIHAFGFGKTTGIALNGESTGILFDLEQLGPVETATTSFGQGISVTPIQQVMAVSAAINGGTLYKPSIVLNDNINNEINNETNKNIRSEAVISENTSKQVRSALESVVAKGTGRGAYVEGYRVGGKTGTAQKVGPNGRYLENNHIVSFIAAAPMDAPEVVVYVAIDNPKNTVQFGGVVAAPIVGRVIRDVLTEKEVKKRDGLEKEVVYPEIKKVPTPDYTGLNKQDVIKRYDYFQIKYSGNGDYVIDQRPKAKEMIKEGGEIELFLGQRR